MKLFNYLLTVLFCMAVWACNDHQQMLSQLEELEQRNLDDSLMTNDSLALSLCEYFDCHGTPNERMRAHYMLARTYTDRGEAPQALEEFHTAITVVDTTAADCDYRRLARIHSQAAGLFFDNSLYNETLDELDLQYKYARKANDTLTWIFAIYSKSDAFYMLGQKDSAIATLQQAELLYRRYGFKSNAIDCAPMLFYIMTEIGRLDEARHYMDLYETQSNHFKDGETEEGFEWYYHYKGQYYAAVHQNKLAELYYRKELLNAQSANDKEGAYKGLYLLFKQQGITDSVAKYADLCYQASEVNYRTKPLEELRRLNALYNYSHNQKIAQDKAHDAARNLSWFIICFVALIIVCFIIVIYIIKVKENKRKTHIEYLHQLELLEQAKYDLIKMNEKKFSLLLEQKEAEIHRRQSVISELQQALHPNATIEVRLSKTDAYIRFCHLIKHPNEKISNEDWKSLEVMMDKHLPNFRKTISPDIVGTDYHICILIRLHFSPSEIANLIEITLQNLYSRRKQLLKKVFNITGKVEEFDRKIQKIK